LIEQGGLMVDKKRILFIVEFIGNGILAFIGNIKRRWQYEFI